MSGKDLEIKMEIEEILQNNSSGLMLKAYFENMSEKKIRRAIHILATIYPGKTAISDDDFIFIYYMLSNKKILTLTQERFSDFIRSLNIIDFSESQTDILIKVIKEHIEALCEVCMYELDCFLIKIFNHSDLFHYLEMLSEDSNAAVLQHISDILRHEDFSDVPDKALENLKNRVSVI